MRIADRPEEGARPIATEYETLEAGAVSRLRVHLITGRTHQIRAHLAHIGHPLLGDGKYGRMRDDKTYGAYYQALCAYKLTFRFKGDAGSLSYLDGKTVSVPPAHVDFLRFFEDGEP